MFVPQLIIIIYGLILLELLFDDSFIIVRYLHFSYLGLLIISASLFFSFLFTKSNKILIIAPAFVFISFSYFHPLGVITTTPSTQMESELTQTSSETDTQSYRFLSFSIDWENKEYQQVVNLLKKNTSDIICLQEVTWSRYELLKKLLIASGQIYYDVYSPKPSLMILSKQPISLDKKIPFIQASTFLGTQPLKIWNIHSPKSLTGMNYQNIYFDQLYEAMQSEQNQHKLLCGDFNSTPQNNILPHFETMLKPAYKASQNPVNLSFTYPTPKGVISAPFPFIKIDYLLFGKTFRIDSYRRIAQYANSDHYPVSATASLRHQTKASDLTTTTTD